MSGAIWVVGELDDDRLRQSSTGIATLAREFARSAGRDIVGVVVGSDPESAAVDLAAFVPRVLWARTPDTDDLVSTSDVAATLAALVEREQPSFLLLPATPVGKELAGSLAARLGWGILAGAVDLEWADGPLVHTVIFKTDLLVRSRFTTGHGLITIQPNIVTPLAQEPVGTTEEVPVVVADPRSRVRRSERVRIPAPASVEGARVIVAGGAGVGSAEAWSVVESLAGVLDAAVGSSRPPVDSGWVPLSQQIGQTGKSVRPDLYVALGISGEVQHRVGMRTAKTVIAINKDPDAPIARFADLFVVGDLHEIVPGVVAAIRERRGG
jgi:electron transfer flavoprotein alpha subunit